MRIAVIGSGPTGQSASVLLARSGHDVVLCERAAELGPVGAGLLIQPTGLRVLDELGVREQIESLGDRITRLYGETHRGRVVLDARYEQLRHDIYGVGLHRAALSSVLDGSRRAAGIELRLGVEAARAVTTGKVAELIDQHDRSLGVFDLIVGCDGARSALRRSVGLVRRDRAYRWGAIWFVGTDSDDRFSGTLSQVYRGTREMIGFLPSGKPAAGGASTVSVFWSVKKQEWESGGVTLDVWKQRVCALAPHAAALVEQVVHREQLLFAPYRDVVLRSSFSGRVVLLGDAAHAMSPQLGQGVNLGLMDAASLAGAVDSCDSIEEALCAFEVERRANVRYYQSASRWLTPVFQSNRPVVGLVRDVCFGPLTRAPFFRRQMLLSLAGVKTGPISHAEIPCSTQAVDSRIHSKH